MPDDQTSNEETERAGEGNAPESDSLQLTDEELDQLPVVLPPEDEAPNVAEQSPAEDDLEDVRFAPPGVEPLPPPVIEQPRPRQPERPPKSNPPPARPTEAYTLEDDERFPPLPPEYTKANTPRPPAAPQPSKPNPRRGIYLTYGSMALVFLGVVALAAFIYRNPYSALNPFPPPTPLPILVTATFLPPTPGPTLQADAVAVAVTAENTAEPADEVPATPTANDRVTGNFVPDDIVTYIANEGNCDWSSIAGTVTDENGDPINGLTIRIENQTTQETETVPTGDDENRFGAGGFELQTGQTPQVEGYTVQLLSTTDEALSDPLTVVTSDQCNQNVTVVNFQQEAP